MTVYYNFIALISESEFIICWHVTNKVVKLKFADRDLVLRCTKYVACVKEMRGRNLSTKYLAKMFRQVLKTILYTWQLTHIINDDETNSQLSSGQEPMAGKGSILAYYQLSFNICSFPPSGSSTKNPRIPSKVELYEAFKSLSVITRLLRSVLFLVASSSHWEWTKEV